MNQHPDPEIHGAQAPLVPINMPENFGSMPGDSCALMSAVYEMPVEYQNDPDTLYAEVPPRTYVFLAAQGIYLNRKDEDSFTFKKALSIAEEWYVEISNVPVENTDRPGWNATVFIFNECINRGREYRNDN